MLFRSVIADSTKGKTTDLSVTFEPRAVADLRVASDAAALKQVAQISRINEAAYSTFVSPWLRAATSPASAEALRALHPMRWTRTLFSERVNPWMALVKTARMAEGVLVMIFKNKGSSNDTSQYRAIMLLQVTWKVDRVFLISHSSA